MRKELVFLSKIALSAELCHSGLEIRKLLMTASSLQDAKDHESIRYYYWQ